MNDLTKTREELVYMVKEQRQEIESLKALLQQSITENDQISLQLKECSKKINFHNLISEILTKYNLSTDDVCQRVVEIMPSAWQVSEHIAASITITDKVFLSSGFQKTDYFISEQIKAGNTLIGSIEVYYTSEDTCDTTNLSQPEESDLLRTVALKLGSFFEIRSFYEAKSENDQQLKIITESSLDAIILLDNDGNISFWNPAAEKLLGYSKEEAVGCNLHKLLAPGKYHAASEKAFGKFRQTGNGPVVNKILELEAITKNGNEIFIELSISGIKIENKWNALGFIRDITQRKHAEVSLQESERRFRNLIENINDVIYKIDIQGNIKYISSPIERIIGFKPEEIIGKNFLDFVGTNAEFLSTRLSMLKEKPEIYNEYKIQSKSGENRWIRLSTKAISSDDQMTGAYGTLIDITEKKQLDIELQKSESLYRSILQASPDTIFISDLNGKVLFTSHMADKMFGFEGVGFPVGESLFRFVDPGDHDKAREAIRLMKSGEFSGATEYLGVKSDGSRFIMEVNGEFIRDLEGNPESMIFIVRDITDRKQTEKNLLLSEARYKSVLDASPDTITIADLEGNIIFSSNKALSMFGIEDPKLIVNRPLWDFFDKSCHDKAIANFMRMVQGVHTGVEEYIGLKADGSTFDIEVNENFIKDESGNLINMVFVTRDITNRKKIEHELLVSQNKYRRLVESINDIVFDITLDGTIKYVSPSVEKIINKRPDDLIGKNFISLVHPDDRELLIDIFRNNSFDKIKHIEYRYLTNEGRIYWVQVSARYTYENGQIVGRSGIMHDITEQKIAEDKLRKSEESFRNIVENINDVVYEVSSEGIIKYVSPSIERLLGYKPEELIGQNFFSYMHEDDKHIIFERLKNLDKRDYSFLEYRYYAKNNEIRWVRSSTNPIVENGRMTGGRDVLIDFTEQKKAEEKLQESEARYKSFFESINSIMLIIDPETSSIIDANPAASRFYGWSRAQLCSMNISEINTLPPNEIKNALQLSKASKHQYFIFKHRLSNGEIRDVEVYSGPAKFGNSTFVHAVIHDITERKQFEEKLKESEARFRMVFENVFDGISIFEENPDPFKRRLIDCNEQYAAMAGRSRDELLEIGYTYTLTKTIEENANELRIKGLNDQTAYHGSFKWLRPDEKDNTIEYIARPIKFQGKSYSIGIDRDITEAKQKEDQLRRLSQAVEQSPVSIVITDLDGKIEYANPQSCKTTGYSLEELKGKNPRVLKSGETSNSEYQQLWNTIATGNQWKGIFHNKRKNGELYWESSQISPIVDSKGRIINYLAVKEDITKQKRIQEELAERESELNFAQEIAQMGSWNLNLKTNKMSWSENYYRMLGLTIYQDDVPSDYFFKMIYPEDAPLIDAMLEEMHHNKKQVSYDMRIVTPDNQIRWMQNNIVPIFEGNNLVILKGVNIDITEKKLAEEKVKQQNERLTAIINAIPDLIFITDKEGTYLEYYKSHLSDKLIYPEEKLIGSNISDFFDAATANLHIQKIKECLYKQQLTTYEYTLNQKGVRNYFEARLVPLANNNVLRFIRDFTSKRLIDNELRKLSLAIEQSPVSIIITDLDANIQYVNPAFINTSGYSYEEIIGQNTKILKSGLTKKEVYNDLWETIAKGLTWKNEWINKKKNGELYWESISITPIFDDQGILINYLAVKQDVSDRKRAEKEILELNLSLEERIKKRTAELAEANTSLIQEIEVRKTAELALAQSEKSYRMVVENVAEVIFQTDTNGLWVFLNNSWETITGFSVKDSIGQLFINFVYPDDREHNLKEFETLIKHEKDYCRHEIRYITKNGNFRWLEVYAKLGIDENNTVIGTYGTLQDITNRKLAEEMVQVQKERLESIIEGSSLGTWEWNVQTGETIFNNRWAELIGYSLDELKPANIETWLKYVHTEDRLISDKLLQQHFRGETDFYVCDVRMRHKDGSWIWVHDSGKVISYTTDGKPLWMFGSHHDITERKKAEIFENEILQLSPKLTGIPLTEIDSAINLAISRIGKVLDADRSYIFEYSADMQYINNTFEWCNDDITPQINRLQTIPTELFPGMMNKLRKLEHVIIESVADLSESWSAEKEILEPQQIQSLILIPMVVDNNLIGFVGLDSVKAKRTYTSSEINTLKIWSSMLSSLINKQRAEKLLEQTRQNYKTFFNTIDDFLFVFDEEGTIVDVNQTVINRLGYQQHEVLNKHITKFRPADRREEVLEVMQNVLTGQLSSCTIPLLTRAGKLIPVETKIKRGFWNGKPVIFGISKDISQIKLSEQKFSSAFHSSSAVMTITRFDDGQFVDVNNAFINTLGYSSEEIKGQSLFSLGIIREPNAGKSLQLALLSGTPVRDIEIKGFSKSNNLRVFLLSAEEIYVGTERCILSVAIDITARKQAEEQLQWNKSLLEMMSNSSPLGFLVVDNRTDDILYFNKRFCQIWGIEHLEQQMLSGKLKNNGIVTHYLPILVDIKGFTESHEPLQDENNRDIISDEIHLTNNRTIHRYSTQIRGIDDKYYGRFYIFEDVTEEKTAEEELRNARNEAERANIAKSEFLSRMSHELRTPLNSILGFAQLLEMGELNAGQQKGVNHIMKSGKHLLDLINEVLDISRIESGRLSLSLEPVQLSSLIPEMTDVIKIQAAERQIKIEIIDSPNNHLFVKSDRQRIKQVILNLLNNAIKYNREGGSVYINIELKPSKMVRISVTDTGHGIAPEFIPKLFTPFERIGADKTNIEGTGLGLSVVKKLMEAMGGNYGVDSNLNQGSTFWIELPLIDSPLVKASQTGTLNKRSSKIDGKTGTILYIEDNLSNIELVEQILAIQRADIELITNNYGQKAIQLSIEYSPNLILLDLNLPDIHGSLVLQQLQSIEETRNIPVVIISADAMPHQLEKLLEAGAKSYLTKPLDIPEFLQLIQDYLPGDNTLQSTE